MRSRALARLVLVSGAATGALVFTVHLGHHSSGDAAATPVSVRGQATASVAGPARSGVAGPAVTAAPAAATGRSGGLDAQRALAQSVALAAPTRAAEPTPYGAGIPVVDESRPHTHVVDPQTGGLVPVATMRGVVPAADDLGPLHADPMPAGTSATDPTDTASLLEKAGVVEAALAASDEPVTLGATAPVGTPGIRTLASHVVPSCSGTGTDGKRVQVLYVHEASTPSRYTAVLPILRNEVANVDDVFAVSAQQTGGDRRVRWVHDADCLPVIKDVTVPDGALGSSFNGTVSALKTLGYTDKNRKYLAFSDANEMCGIGTLYNDTRLTGNYNDGYAASYARVDTSCWSTGHSVAAHELTHNLGGVQQGAPHATVNGHCWDESDLMCYDDAEPGQPDVAMKQVCASSQEWLLDCNHDDYFSTNPPAGSFLAKSWNTASSSFLDPGPAPTTPTTPVDVTVRAASPTARTGDTVGLTATSSRTVTWAWAATGGCAVTPGASGSASLVCPSTGAGTVTVTATATEAGTAATGTGTTSVAVTRAPAPTVAVTAPGTATTGTAFQVAATGTGQAPFTWRWTAGGCTVAAPTAASTAVTCPAAGSVTVGLTGTQRDGQTATRTASVTVSAPVVTPPPTVPPPTVPPPPLPPAPAPSATAWSTPRVSGGVVSATLTSGGRAVALVPVRVQAWSGSGWVDVTRTTTAWTGTAGVRNQWAGRLRFVYDGDAARAASASPAVRVRIATRLSPSAAPRRAGTVLSTATGSRLGAAAVVLQRRAHGSTHWATVARTRTDRSGHAVLRVGAPRRASYRWVFPGAESWEPAVSAAFSVRS